MRVESVAIMVKFLCSRCDESDDERDVSVAIGADTVFVLVAYNSYKMLRRTFDLPL